MEVTKEKIIKIAVIGVESSGKTTLAKKLSKILNIKYIEEKSRFYLSKKKGIYTEKDVENIAKEQFKANNVEHESMVCDTELLVCKIWYEHKYKKQNKIINTLFEKQQFDIYLLMDNDLEWVFDLLRETPQDEERQLLQKKYIDHLEISKLPYFLISGKGTQRAANALEKLKNIL